MKIGWQLTKLLQKLSGLLFWPTLYVARFQGLLTDSVDTSLVFVMKAVCYIIVQQMRCSVKCTISKRAEKDVRS